MRKFVHCTTYEENKSIFVGSIPEILKTNSVRTELINFEMLGP